MGDRAKRPAVSFARLHIRGQVWGFRYSRANCDDSRVSTSRGRKRFVFASRRLQRPAFDRLFQEPSTSPTACSLWNRTPLAAESFADVATIFRIGSQPHSQAKYIPGRATTQSSDAHLPVQPLRKPAAEQSPGSVTTGVPRAKPRSSYFRHRNGSDRVARRPRRQSSGNLVRQRRQKRIRSLDVAERPRESLAQQLVQ